MTESVAEVQTGFETFQLDERLERGIRAAGFTEPRPIQVETIPAGLRGRDVLGLAQTGTGKTAAFALPLLQRLLERKQKGPRVLVLAPTRELATQISEEIRTLARFTKLKMVTIYGGVSQRNQVYALKSRPEIVVGCPGRVLDLVSQRLLRLDQVETLVLDEADHMFDMGFLPDVRSIISVMPHDRQNLLFSATMPKEIRHLANDLLDNPKVVEMATRAPAETIDHGLVMVAEHRKRDLLQMILKSNECESAIVFTRTKHRARRLAEQLVKEGHKAVAIQGNMTQAQRDRAMQGFRKRKFNVLVATDIVARGIDVSGVSHVLNFDVPNTPEAYTHRIGRTGRAELAGTALTFVTGVDFGWVRATERMIGNPIPRRLFDGFEADAEVKPKSKKSGWSHPHARSSGGRKPSRGQGGSSRGYGGGGGSSSRSSSGGKKKKSGGHPYYGPGAKRKKQRAS